MQRCNIFQPCFEEFLHFTHQHLRVLSNRISNILTDKCLDNIIQLLGEVYLALFDHISIQLGSIAVVEKVGDFFASHLLSEIEEERPQIEGALHANYAWAPSLGASL
eukprot:gene7164-biopygen14032